jgi:DNA-binding transcriptional LysR family regulator
MPRRLPPLNALGAFVVAARSENFTRAAEELGVSQVAASQQVKSLEAALGLKLFARDGKRLVITDAGKQYLSVVRDALDRIALGTGCFKAGRRVSLPSARHRISAPSGSCTGLDALLRTILRSTSASP